MQATRECVRCRQQQQQQAGRPAHTHIRTHACALCYAETNGRSTKARGGEERRGWEGGGGRRRRSREGNAAMVMGGSAAPFRYHQHLGDISDPCRLPSSALLAQAQRSGCSTRAPRWQVSWRDAWPNPVRVEMHCGRGTDGRVCADASSPCCQPRVPSQTPLPTATPWTPIRSRTRPCGTRSPRLTECTTTTSTTPSLGMLPMRMASPRRRLQRGAEGSRRLGRAHRGWRTCSGGSVRWKSANAISNSGRATSRSMGGIIGRSVSVWRDIKGTRTTEMRDT